MAVNSSRASQRDGQYYNLRVTAFGGEEASAAEPGQQLIGTPQFWGDITAPTAIVVIEWEVTVADLDGGTGELYVTLATSEDGDNAVTLVSRAITDVGHFRDVIDLKTAATLAGDALDGERWIACGVTLTGGSGGEIVNYGCAAKVT